MNAQSRLLDIFRRGALLSGGAVAGTLAFPPVEIPALAWLMPLCWLFALDGLSARARFGAGLAAGFLFYVLGARWIMQIFGAFALVLMVIPSLYMALWAAGTKLGDGMAPLGRMALAGALWVCGEYFRAEVMPPNFAWLALGFTQTGGFGAALAPAVGVYGIAFAMVFWAGAMRWLSGEHSTAARAGLVALCLVPAVSFLPGPDPEAAALARVDLVQLANEYEPEDVPAATEPPDLVVWPEYTFFRDPTTNDGAPFMERLRADAATSRHGILFGALDFRSSDLSAKGAFYNTIFMLGPEGNIRGRAIKNRPIPFLRDGTPAPSISVLGVPGMRSVRGDGPLRLGVGVCYDASFQRFARRMAAEGADVLVFPSYNASAWGAIQHRQFHRIFQMRAMENGLPLVVAASSGPTVAVTPWGRSTEPPPFHQTARVSATLRAPSPRRTVFTVWGWLVGPGSLVVVAGLLAVRAAETMRERKAAEA